MAKKRLYLKIYGEVQGVNFRYNIAKQARKLELCGWVRNTRAGTVESELEGEERSLKEILQWAKKGPTWAKVERVVGDWRDFKGDFQTFEVRY